MNGIPNYTYYGVFSTDAEDFIRYTTLNYVREIKKLCVNAPHNVQASVILYAQRYTYGAKLFNKKAMCALSFHYDGKDTYYCGTLKAAEKTFRVIQKAIEKQCMR
jgi:hypothetical protein